MFRLRALGYWYPLHITAARTSRSNPMDTRSGKIRVVFIAGIGRSGSTLLDRVLGQIDKVTACGELYHLFNRGFADNQLCGCGQAFRDCTFWRAVISEAFGGIESFDLEAFLQVKNYVHRPRHIPALLVPLLRWPKYQRCLAQYLDMLSRLYPAIARVSGANVIIDSSKYPLHGFALRLVPNIDLRIVHLVRDSRAVAYSWQRKRVRTEIRSRLEYQKRYSAIASAFQWNYKNILTHLLSRGCAGKSKILYENFVRQPRLTLAEPLQAALGFEPELPFLSGQTCHLAPTHTVAGNPNRLESGRTTLRLDDEWRQGMGRGQHAIVTILTMPLLMLYGYTLRA